MRFSVDPWDVEYGSSQGFDLADPSTGEINVELERAEGEWAPIDSATGVAAARRVVFVDGVRRIDARVWIDGDDGDVHPGLCASFAAGAVCCGTVAEVITFEVERGVFSTAATATDITTTLTTYPARMAASPDLDGLMLAVHERMTQTEVAIARAARADASVELIVVDGPLRGRQHIEGTVGFVKSHAVVYLPPDLPRMVGTLGARQRTPVFTVGTSYSRHSWYLRLPGPGSCGASARRIWLPPRRSSSPTARAPPCRASHPSLTRTPAPRRTSTRSGGLERELRRRLGDQQILYRSLRAAAGAPGVGSAVAAS
jgi:hypothetical protein